MPVASDSLPRRCFVALPLPDPARASVLAATAQLREAVGRGVRWTDPATLHLTLRFLGPVARSAESCLRAELAAAASPLAPCELRLAGAGAFPTTARPRVLWLGVEPTPTLVALHQAVEGACAAAGLGREQRPVRPHLTVGRPRPGVPLPAGALAATLARVGFVAEVRAATFQLMASELTRTGARHTSLAAFRLGAVEAAGANRSRPGAR